MLNLAEIKENAVAAYADDEGGDDIFNQTSGNLNQTGTTQMMFNN